MQRDHFAGGYVYLISGVDDDDRVLTIREWNEAQVQPVRTVDWSLPDEELSEQLAADTDLDSEKR